MSMFIAFLAIPEEVLPLDADGGGSEQECEELLYARHTCCSAPCEQFKSGVIMLQMDATCLTINEFVFEEVDALTFGELTEFVGNYESHQLRRIHSRAYLLARLRACLEIGRMKAFPFGEWFLAAFVNSAEKALAEHGAQAVIWNH